jgi:hypothetical protein
MFSKSEVDALSGVAREYGIKPSAFLALGLKESGGRPMWRLDGINRPAIRFEGHYFFRYLKTKPDQDKAVELGLANPRAGAVKNPNSYRARYDLFNRAAAIDMEAAIKSTSWGWGQVMGAHFRLLGFESARRLLDAASSLRGQSELVAGFLRSKRLIADLNALPNRAAATRFAAAYNGPRHARNKYVPRLIDAFHKIEGGNAKVSGVIDAQRMLKTLGYDPGPLDGILGRKTTAAVQLFQISQGVPADGDPGPMTLERLRAEVARKKSARKKRAAPVIAVGGGAIATGGGQLMGALGEGAGAAGQARGLMSTLGLEGMGPIFAIVGGVLVLGVTGYVIWRFMQPDPEAEE